MKIAIVDLDGVVADSSARFAKAEEAKQSALAQNATDRQATSEYWRSAFTPELVDLDTLIDGADLAVKRLEQRAGYNIVFLTSRPEDMHVATEKWLTQHDLDGYELVTKPTSKQFTKTVTWKADEVKRMASLGSVEAVLFIDDEQANRAAVEALGLGIACKSSLDDYKPDDRPIIV